ncbi:hypothetical protein GOBAR_AA36454 [Gossypium barbadense]|uniref:RNA-binding protein 12-like n=2 Tax=Gossypium barbadense TaxID=3634 RepID=A0A2P5VZK0_GOSBA|nr:hypothetical protein GOBAR_AA36454 [Gossypium barbadense]
MSPTPVAYSHCFKTLYKPLTPCSLPHSKVAIKIKRLCLIYLTEMASFNCFALAFFVALSFSSIDVGLAARQLQQLPPMPTLPTTTLPPLPSIPNLPQPSIPPFPRLGALPPLPTMPALPTLPPLPSMPSIPTIPTTIRSIPFFSPPPSPSSP